MQVDVTGHQIEVTDSMREYVLEKLERIKRHFDQLINVHVILSVEKLSQKAEATISANGTTLFANAEQEDMYAAIDSLIDKLDRQAIKYKEKITSHR